MSKVLFPVAGVLVLLVCPTLIGCEAPEEELGSALAIESEPPGAVVLIGDEVYGPTPCLVEGLSGEYVYLIFLKEGYRRTNHMVTLVPSAEPTPVHVTLEALVGFLSMETDPYGALVYIDDELKIGETPFRNAPIPVGSHTYQIRLADYETLEYELEVERDFRYSRRHILPPKDAELRVSSRPFAGAIRINGDLQVQTTPARIFLTPGTYTVSVEAKGYVTGERTVVLRPNQKKSVEMKLKEGYVPEGMVLIPAGNFIFGGKDAPDERPVRTLACDAYYIDKYEVTNQQYQKVFREHTFEPAQARFPVTNVSWSLASEYARAVGKRLPTENEWEKAARGTKGFEFPWGNNFNASLCNSGAGKKPRLQRVGEHRAGASAFGVMDMAGNVYEWTHDVYQPYQGNEDIETDYGQVYRVLRGGSYLSDPYDVRCAKRHYDKMDNTREDYGFRCASDLSAVPS